jgi:DNA replication protein DnaC
MIVELDLLLLDDAGRANQTDWVSSTLFRIIDGRYREKRPTIVATNWPIARLREQPAWAPLVSRLLDDGGRVIALTGADLRQSRPAA